MTNKQQKPIVESKADYDEVYYKVLALMPKNRDIKIFDAGCGTGYFETILWGLGYKNVTGVDTSKKFLKVARQRTPHYKFKRYDLNKKFPFKTNYFDIAIGVEFLEHVISPVDFVREMLRVSKEIIITTPNGFWAEFYQWLTGQNTFPTEHIFVEENELKNIFHFLKAKIKVFDYQYSVFKFGRNLFPRFLSSRFIVKASKGRYK